MEGEGGGRIGCLAFGCRGDHGGEGGFANDEICSFFLFYKYNLVRRKRYQF